MKRAVVFDLDGTLLDTLEDLAVSMNAVLEEMGCAVHAVNNYRFFVGEGMRMLVRRALPESAAADPDAVDTAVGLMKQRYAQGWRTRTRPYEGVGRMLDSVEALGLPMCVLSNKPREFALKSVEYFLPKWKFHCVCGGDECFPRKPDPSGALYLARAVNIAPCDFAYLGDTGTDMETARGAGMYAVGALWGFRSAGELLAAGAQVLLRSPEELTDILRR
jgi:phosphoglycolate phosphatase